MRIRAIKLSWFRGAADPVSLALDGKSMVVYGENGSGKSSFVDAVEYVLNHGKIHHLAHEYSGKHQERAVPNTHKPKGRTTELVFKFQDNSELRIEIKDNGTYASSGADAVAMGTWDHRRTVLRQDEVAGFIHDTKGGKYSALLPLLGLHQMEVAAENLRHLAKAVEKQSRIKEARAILKGGEARRTTTFGSDSDEMILRKIGDLTAKYCKATTVTGHALARCEELETAMDARMSRFSVEQRRYLALHDAAQLDLKGHVDAVRAANATLAGVAEPLVAEKLEVLHSTGLFMAKLGASGDVDCPACGRSIPVDALQRHHEAERTRLQATIDTFNSRKATIGTLCDSVTSLRSTLGKVDVRSWRNELTETGLADSLKYLDGLSVEQLRASCGGEELGAIESNLLPLIEAAASSSKEAPLDIEQLSTEKQMVSVAKAVIEARELTDKAASAEALISFISALEHGVRAQIRVRSQAVVQEISADIQAMWKVLHPSDAIEDVRVYLPDDADKAIDVGLKFHGVRQDSPRLTLSEGYRNSLGLCIFLAMAKREAEKDRPLFLDDVAVSLDRNHRGMIAELIEKEFGGRQVIILTHDREWYTELRQHLDGKDWRFSALLPYETPAIGIRWSHKTTTFDDARAHLNERPDSAGNDARKIMDVELALIAERLHVSLPYLRAEKNDKRTAHEFLERLIGEAKKCFQMKVGKDYVAHSNAIDAFDKADRLLVSWANRASHTFDVVRPEATKLIDTCEKVLEFFKCPSCGKYVWFAEAEGAELVQCQCGEIRWRYGRA